MKFVVVNATMPREADELLFVYDINEWSPGDMYVGASGRTCIVIGVGPKAMNGFLQYVRKLTVLLSDDAS